MLYSTAMNAIAHALHMDLLPALSALLASTASPACAPTAGAAGLRARTAALEALVGLCGLSFHDPTALGSFDRAPVTHKEELLQQMRQQRAGQHANPQGSGRMGSSMQRPVGAAVLGTAASCARFDHACKAVRVAEGPARGGRGRDGGSSSW